MVTASPSLPDAALVVAGMTAAGARITTTGHPTAMPV